MCVGACRHDGGNRAADGAPGRATAGGCVPTSRCCRKSRPTARAISTRSGAAGVCEVSASSGADKKLCCATAGSSAGSGGNSSDAAAHGGCACAG